LNSLHFLHLFEKKKFDDLLTVEYPTPANHPSSMAILKASRTSVFDFPRGRGMCARQMCQRGLKRALGMAFSSRCAVQNFDIDMKRMWQLLVVV
jgi:hypothetical protein